ncbi:MAG: 2-oxo acid dehydrogenase subunit E2 [Steroidobacteraceae bacterium]|jgi:2-oxoisovalerate dehydrogenase E2 component (dihydrolipoyl transacylase)|nr:2-oxo acid dehydrogenase subunit E2 [Steroidobacteraceae bacterium]
MSRFVFKLPDLGEGTVTAEIVEWKVKIGDHVEEDQVIAEMMTDKAAVEVPAPVSGTVVAVAGQPGDMVAVGSELIVFDTDGAGSPAQAAAPHAAASPAGSQPLAAAPPAAPAVAAAAVAQAAPEAAARGGGSGRVMASPATRRRALEAGIDLSQVAGSGPGGRIQPEDLDRLLAGGQAVNATAPAAAPVAAPRAGTEEIKVIGVRRLIAQRMTEAKRNIPHFAYVEEVDVTELESLRQHLNSRLPKGEAGLTFLPFIVAALTRVLADFPQCNAHYDEARGVIVRHHAVHVGIAAQTPDGLKVPVVKNAEARTLAGLAAEIRRVSEAARSGKASKEDLTGSTITVTSLGRLGGIVSTPVINAPEVAIVGVNKAIERPVVHNGAITVRRMMNLSSSFDHRFVDGFDAAAMIQALKDRLEHPATIFIQD